MSRVYLVLVLGLVLAACAPTVMWDSWGEVDLARILPGSGTYTPPRGFFAALPTVSEERLTHPDRRVREEAFALLMQQKMVGEDTGGPEFQYLYGRYYEASGDYENAASYYNLGLWKLKPFAFDRQGRDIWEYGYRRAEAYLRFAPDKAARDARILAEKGAPARPGELPQAARAYALLVRAEEALGNPEGVLAAAEAFYRSLQGVNWGSRVADLFWRTTLAKARALERLGRLAEAREEYARIASTRDLFLPDEVRREAREALVRLGAPKTQEAPACPRLRFPLRRLHRRPHRFLRSPLRRKRTQRKRSRASSRPFGLWTSRASTGTSPNPSTMSSRSGSFPEGLRRRCGRRLGPFGTRWPGLRLLRPQIPCSRRRSSTTSAESGSSLPCT